MKCIRCDIETEYRWPSGPQGLCNGLPFLYGTPEHDAALAACLQRSDARDSAIRSANAQVIFDLVAAAYGGLPLALVEVSPVLGDVVEAPDGEVLQVGEEGAGFRHSATNDGLIWFQDGAERDGYALRLLTPENPPGSRRWLVTNRDRRDPQVVAVDIVTTVTIRGSRA